MFSFNRSACVAAVLFLAAPILHADGPATFEKLDYIRPEGVSTTETRVVGRAHGSGASRSPNASNHIPVNLLLTFLSPRYTSLTVQEHPSIFWYMSEPVKGAKYKISILKAGDAEPFFEKQLDAEKDTGIQRLDLGSISKSLEPGTEYELVVSVIETGSPIAQDVTSKAIIKRVPATDKLLAKLLTRATPADRAAVYAVQGIWYDALTAISDQIAAEPNNKRLHLLRAQLLEKGDLTAVAEYEKQLVN